MFVKVEHKKSSIFANNTDIQGACVGAVFHGIHVLGVPCRCPSLDHHDALGPF